MDREHIELWQRLAGFEFDEPRAAFTFTQRLARENGWSVGYAERVIDEYRRFVFLAMTAGHEVTPSEQVDQAWHLHLTYSRNYWEDLCAATLGLKLHHGPTRGGRSDAARFITQYEQTLASYRVAFGQDPPLEIWPPAVERFGDPRRFVRVDRRKVWVIPKPWHCLQPLIASKNRQMALLAAPVMLLALENPLNFAGPQFLGFFAVLLAVAMAGAFILRWVLRPGENAARGPLDSYQIACLSGGVEGTVQAAVAALVHRGALKISRSPSAGVGVHDYKIYSADGTPPDANELEQRVMAACGELDGSRFAQVIEYARPAAEKIKYRLETWGLLVSSDGLPSCCWVPSLVVLLTLTIGVAKLIVGIQRDKPVGFLLALLGLCVVMALLFLKRPLRTRAGTAELQKLRGQHHHLRHRRTLQSESCASGDFALATALFGLPAIAFGDTLLMADAWKYRSGPPSVGDGATGCGVTSGCGDGGGGGGCGGGGCGGCGS